MRVGLIVHLDIEPGHFDEFVEIVRRHGAYSVENEPGCLSFTVIHPEEEQYGLVLVETYEDESALESHWNSPHMNAYRERTAGMIRSRTRQKGPVL